MNMQLVDVARRPSRERRRSSPAPATPCGPGGSRRRIRGGHAQSQSQLLPTIQQAITSLLTTYEPEFLRFGYGCSWRSPRS